MRNLVFIRALRRVDGRNFSVHPISAQKQYLCSLYMKSPVRHDSCTNIRMHTRSRLRTSKPSGKNQLTGQCAWNVWANKETNKSSPSCVISAIAPMSSCSSLALIVEFVHINVGRWTGLVLLCLSYFTLKRWPLAVTQLKMTMLFRFN
jgi:hypothetical protein